MNFKDFCKSLETKIKNTYQEGITLEDAEKLAAEFLFAQLRVSSELKTKDLDARMRKSGTKSVRAAIYLDIVQKSEKKPTESQMTAMIDTDTIVMNEQNSLDLAEVERDELERYYSIFRESHIYFRGISKGKFE